MKPNYRLFKIGFSSPAQVNLQRAILLPQLTSQACAAMFSFVIVALIRRIDLESNCSVLKPESLDLTPNPTI